MYWKMALSTNYRSVISIILARSDLSANYYAFLRLFRWSRPRVSVKLRIGFIKLILTGQTLIEFLQDLEWPKFKSGEPSWNDSFHYSHPFQYFVQAVPLMANILKLDFTLRLFLVKRIFQQLNYGSNGMKLHSILVTNI